MLLCVNEKKPGELRLVSGSRAKFDELATRRVEPDGFVRVDQAGDLGIVCRDGRAQGALADVGCGLGFDFHLAESECVFDHPVGAAACDVGIYDEAEVDKVCARALLVS